MKYRNLEDLETIQSVDQYSTNGINNWLDSGPHFVGRLAKEYGGGSHWRRPIKEHNWISFKERKPTKEDCANDTDVPDYVVCRKKGYTGYRRWNDISETEFTHWMPLNFVEDKPTPIKVDGKEIIPLKNGDVKLSCGTTIPASDMKEFLRQREEVMK